MFEKKTNNNILTFLKGLGVGASMLIPGVSGGTMAMILGIYDQLIGSVSNLFHNLKKNLFFLTLFSLGGLVGILLFAKPLLYLTERYHFLMMYFFIGAVAGSVPLIYKKASTSHQSYTNFIYPLIGIGLVFFFALMSDKQSSVTLASNWQSFMLLLISGIIAAIALVLPGISVSYMLLLMGMYDSTMSAITTFNLSYLIPLGLGVLLGIGLTTKVLEYALTRHTRITYLIILGFILGSIAEVFPGIPPTVQLLPCLILFSLGFIAIKKLSALEAN